MNLIIFLIEEMKKLNLYECINDYIKEILIKIMKQLIMYMKNQKLKLKDLMEFLVI